MISVTELSLTIGTKTLLDSISFEIGRGEYVAIIGPNGSGKSTLLKCLDKIISNSSGEIRLDGISISQIRQVQLARRIAFVQQSSRVPFSFTVKEIIEMGRYPHLAPLTPISNEDKQIVDDALEMMHIKHLTDRWVDTLSGGESQKVHIAAALAQQSEILLLDEPTTYLDYKHQSEIGSLLRNLNQKYGKTIIEVTHDVNRAVLDATHVIALVEGKIAYDGAPEFLMQPEHLRDIYQIDFQLVDHPSLPLKVVVPGI